MVKRLSTTILFLIASGCSERAPAPTPSPPPTTPADAAPEQWTVWLRSFHGPCRESDPVPCRKEWRVKADGTIDKAEAANKPGSPVVKTTVSLSAAELDMLRALVRSPEFRDGVAHGFPCQGKGRSYDWTLELAFRDPVDRLDGTQNVERCVMSSTSSDTAAAKIVNLIRR
jgi:hypothetical protein